VRTTLPDLREAAHFNEVFAATLYVSIALSEARFSITAHPHIHQLIALQRKSPPVKKLVKKPHRYVKLPRQKLRKAQSGDSTERRNDSNTLQYKCCVKLKRNVSGQRAASLHALPIYVLCMQQGCKLKDKTGCGQIESSKTQT